MLQPLPSASSLEHYLALKAAPGPAAAWIERWSPIPARHWLGPGGGCEQQPAGSGSRVLRVQEDGEDFNVFFMGFLLNILMVAGPGPGPGSTHGFCQGGSVGAGPEEVTGTM